VVVARLFNTVGPRQTGRYGMVLPTFVRQALAGDPMTVHGDGSQTRCFCDVADVAAALVRLADHPGAVGGVFNVGSDEEVSVGELAELVKGLADSSSDVVYVSYSEAFRDGFKDIPRRVPDLTKVRRLIGYRPTRSLEQIVRRVIDARRPAVRRPALV
jgi:UDP-glucose 4-epimerase